MRFYETTFIVNPQADDAAIDKNVSAISDIITTHGGHIIHTERMGNRRLSYEIAGLTQGHYASHIFQAPPEVIAMLERHYRLEEPYMRHLTITFDGDPMAIKERQDAFVSTLEENEERARQERRERMSEDRDFRGGGGGRGRWGGDRGGDRGGHRGPREGGGGGYRDDRPFRGPRDEHPRPPRDAAPTQHPVAPPPAPQAAPKPPAPSSGSEGQEEL